MFPVLVMEKASSVLPDLPGTGVFENAAAQIDEGGGDDHRSVGSGESGLAGGVGDFGNDVIGSIGHRGGERFEFEVERDVAVGFEFEVFGERGKFDRVGADRFTCVEIERGSDGSRDRLGGDEGDILNGVELLTRDYRWGELPGNGGGENCCTGDDWEGSWAEGVGSNLAWKEWANSVDIGDARGNGGIVERGSSPDGCTSSAGGGWAGKGLPDGREIASGIAGGISRGVLDAVGEHLRVGWPGTPTTFKKR